MPPACSYVRPTFCPLAPAGRSVPSWWLTPPALRRRPRSSWDKGKPCRTPSMRGSPVGGERASGGRCDAVDWELGMGLLSMCCSSCSKLGTICALCMQKTRQEVAMPPCWTGNVNVNGIWVRPGAGGRTGWPDGVYAALEAGLPHLRSGGSDFSDASVTVLVLVHVSCCSRSVAVGGMHCRAPRLSGGCGREGGRFGRRPMIHARLCGSSGIPSMWHALTCCPTMPHCRSVSV